LIFVDQDLNQTLSQTLTALPDTHQQGAEQ